MDFKSPHKNKEIIFFDHVNKHGMTKAVIAVKDQVKG